MGLRLGPHRSRPRSRHRSPGHRVGCLRHRGDDSRRIPHEPRSASRRGVGVAFSSMSTRPSLPGTFADIARAVLVGLAIALAFYVLVGTPAAPLNLLAGAILALAVAFLIS